MSKTLQQITVQILPMDNGGYSVFGLATHLMAPITGEGMPVMQEQYREYVSDANDLGSLIRQITINESSRKKGDNYYA